MIMLKYGNTNTYLVKGSAGNLLIDTDYAGTLYAFYKALKANEIQLKDIDYVLATHYHPDHMGLISELMKMGVKLLLIDVQKPYIHDSDTIFARDKIAASPIDGTLAAVISCEESRDFLKNLGISGEIIRTASHSEDSVSLVLDNGDCFVGDLEPFEYIDLYAEDTGLEKDWEKLLSFNPQRICYAHRPAQIIH